MTARELTATILQNRYRRSFCLPCYTPAGWWECDVFEITKAGYFKEYEIKASRADFKADAKKIRLPGTWRREGVTLDSGNKHDLLEERSTRGPVQFWFVTPAGLLELGEVPEWAGLIEVDENENWRGERYLYERQAKKAPRLHRDKLPQAVADHARGVCYYRLMNELIRKAS